MKRFLIGLSSLVLVLIALEGHSQGTKPKCPCDTVGKMWIPTADALKVLQAAEEAKNLKEQLASCTSDSALVWGKIFDLYSRIATWKALDSVSRHQLELVREQLDGCIEQKRTLNEQASTLQTVIDKRDKQIKRLQRGKRGVGIAGIILIIGALLIKK